MTPTADDTNTGSYLRSQLGLLLPEEVAKCFQVTVETLAAWRSNKNGPIPTRLGKSVYYHIDDLRDWSRPPATYRQPTLASLVSGCNSPSAENVIGGPNSFGDLVEGRQDR